MEEHTKESIEKILTPVSIRNITCTTRRQSFPEEFEWTITSANLAEAKEMNPHLTLVKSPVYYTGEKAGIQYGYRLLLEFGESGVNVGLCYKSSPESHRLPNVCAKMVLTIAGITEELGENKLVELATNGFDEVVPEKIVPWLTYIPNNWLLEPDFPTTFKFSGTMSTLAYVNSCTETIQTSNELERPVTIGTVRPEDISTKGRLIHTGRNAVKLSHTVSVLRDTWKIADEHALEAETIEEENDDENDNQHMELEELQEFS